MYIVIRHKFGYNPFASSYSSLKIYNLILLKVKTQKLYIHKIFQKRKTYSKNKNHKFIPKRDLKRHIVYGGECAQ